MPAKKKTVDFPTPAPTAPEPSVTITANIGGLQPDDERLQAIAHHGAKDLAKALAHQEVQILEDIARIRQEEGDKGNFKIGLSLTLNLADNTIDTAVSYSIKSTTKASHAVDPDKDDGQGQFGFTD